MSKDSPPNNAPPPEANPARFEEALTDLEQLVEQLERGDLSLEESLAQFERGVGLARECRDSLAAAEQKIQILVEREGEDERLADFDPGQNQAGAEDAGHDSEPGKP